MLLNLGSPDSTKTQDVRRYLREFLSDPRVIDLPAPARQAILNLFILPFRPKKSAEAYASIWTQEGSPLVVTTYRVAALLRERLGASVPVEVGMRYGNPSTEAAVTRLHEQGVQHMLIVPLYPHYAMSSYETAVTCAQEAIARLAPSTRITVQPPYFDHPSYIDALAAVTKPYLEERAWDYLLYSYHGIPERHLTKADPSDSHCLQSPHCCEGAHPCHATCYRHQVFATTHALNKKMGIDLERTSLSFQSRLGTTPWLRPYTDKEFERLPSLGVRRLAVICPAFVSDCLETLEEIAMRGREDFEAAGGTELIYIPCLNDHPAWISVLEEFYRDFEATASAEQARS